MLPESGSAEGFQADILFSEAASLEAIAFALSSSVYSHYLFHKISLFKSKGRDCLDIREGEVFWEICEVS